VATKRGPRVRSGRFTLLSITHAVVLVLCVVASAHAQTAQSGPALTNDDVVKMVRAQIGSHIILTAIEGSNANFDVSPAGLITLKEAGVSEEIIQAMQARVASLRQPAPETLPGSAPEKSELLATAKDPAEVLRHFKTMFVDASGAKFFGTDQMKAALGKNKDFAPLKITIVDNRSLADVVLTVGYTFAWDYPFALTHQNTTMVLLSGKGTGPFSGPAGATSVAAELIKTLKPHRAAPAPGT
jgi:hypothetical protein